MKPLITVLMPAFNGMPFIKEAVGSVLFQSLHDWRLIISDNGSSDGTRGYLRSLEATGDSRIEVFFQTKNLGIFGNLNFLFDQADPNLPSHILCADDYLKSSKSLTIISSFFAQNSHCLDVVRWNGSSLRSGVVPSAVSGLSATLYFFLCGNLMGNLSCVSCKGDPRNLIGPFNQDYPYVGDFEFWSRLAGSGASVAIQSKEIVSVRSHSAQASKYLNQKGEKYIEQSIVTSKLYSNLAPSLGPYEKVLLSLAGTLMYDSPYRLSAMRVARLNPAVLDSLNAASRFSPYLLKSPWRDLLFLVSLGGRLWTKILIKIALWACLKKIHS